MYFKTLRLKIRKLCPEMFHKRNKNFSNKFYPTQYLYFGLLFTWGCDRMCLLNMIVRQKCFENDKDFYRLLPSTETILSTSIAFYRNHNFHENGIKQIFICTKYFSVSWSIWQNNSLTTHKQHYTIYNE